MQRLSRPTALKLAALLSFLIGIASFVGILPLLAQRQADLDLGDEGASFFFLIAVLIFAILRIIGAYGTWTNQRWGIVMTILGNLLDGLFALPGLLFAPDLEWRIAAYIGVFGGLAIIALCLWRDNRSATSRLREGS